MLDIDFGDMLDAAWTKDAATPGVQKAPSDVSSLAGTVRALRDAEHEVEQLRAEVRRLETAAKASTSVRFLDASGALSRSGRQDWVSRNGALRFTWMTRSHSPGSQGAIGVSGPSPAHWMAWLLPSIIRCVSTVMQKPSTPIAFISRRMLLFSASADATGSSSSESSSESEA